jgi:outer membrane protein assembly factor BamB
VLPGVAAAGGLVLVAANNELLAVDARSGTVLWEHRVAGQTPRALEVAGEEVYAGCQNSVQAFSARTGRELWSYPAEGQIMNLAAGGGTVYAAADPGGPGYTLYALRGTAR